MRIAIADANVFIDLFELNCINILFSLKYEFVITLEVFNELNPRQQKVLSQWLGSGQLRIVEVQLKDYPKINLIIDSNKLSFTDKTALFISKKDKLLLLTGDKIVRASAENLGLKTYSMVWIFDSAVENKIISQSDARLTLKQLMQINSWISIDECNERITKWESQIIE